MMSIWTSGEHPMDVRFGIIYYSLTSPEYPWDVHVWWESDLPKTFLMSIGYPGDFGQYLACPSLVRTWHLQDIIDIPRMSRRHQATKSKFGQNLMVIDISDIHRLSKGCQNTSLVSMNWFRDVRFKSLSLVRMWLHSSQPISDIQGTSWGSHLLTSDPDVMETY